MPVPELEGIEIESAEGLWRVEYIGAPDEIEGHDRFEYNLRIKWVDPNNRDNRVTPERRLRIIAYHTQFAVNDADERLRNAVRRWVELAVDESEAEFDYNQQFLIKPRANDNAN